MSYIHYYTWLCARRFLKQAKTFDQSSHVWELASMSVISESTN